MINRRPEQFQQHGGFSPTLPTGGAQTGGFNPGLPPQMQATQPPQAQTAMPPQMQQPNAQAFANANQNANFIPQTGGPLPPATQEQQLSYRSDVGNAPAFMPPQQMPGVPQYGGGQFNGQGGKGGQAQPPQGGDWQNRFQQIMGQNWPSQQQATQQGKGGQGGQAKPTFGSDNSWS